MLVVGSEGDVVLSIPKLCLGGFNVGWGDVVDVNEACSDKITEVSFVEFTPAASSLLSAR